MNNIMYNNLAKIIIIKKGSHLVQILSHILPSSIFSLFASFEL